jgi:hypothetical protein
MSVGSTELSKRAEARALPALERETSVGSTELINERRSRLRRLRSGK